MQKGKRIAAVLSFVLAGMLTVTGCSSAAERQTHKNSIGMEFVLIPAGSFEWEADAGDVPNIFGDPVRVNIPARNVTIGTPFYLGKYEVTQGEWEAVMGSNPSKFKGRNNPVEHVSWDDAQEFIRRLNKKEGHTRYRLPTEAEWEYAARAGTDSAYSFGDDENELSGYAWYDEDYYTGSTHPAGGKRANPWGLHDVHGNVWEWVQDWYGEMSYGDTPGTDPREPAKDSDRVGRGGAWNNGAKGCRSGRWVILPPDSRGNDLGFRLALSPE